MHFYVYINWTYIAVKTIGISICNPAPVVFTNSVPDLTSYVCTQYTPRAISGFQFHRRWSSSLIIHLLPPKKKGGHCLYSVKKLYLLFFSLFFCWGDAEKMCFFRYHIYLFFIELGVVTWNERCTIFCYNCFFQRDKKNCNKKLVIDVGDTCFTFTRSEVYNMIKYNIIQYNIIMIKHNMIYCKIRWTK